MQIQIKIEDEKISLPIGKGYNDWVWLAHYASRVYSKIVYPTGVYIPTMLYLQTKNNQYTPHPRQRIKFYLQQQQLSIKDIVVIIKIRKANHILTQYQKSNLLHQVEWQAQAFGVDRYMSQYKFSYKVATINKKKDYFLKIKLNFNICQELRDMIDPKTIQNTYQLILQQKLLSSSQVIFQGSIKLPYGNISYKLLYYQRQNSLEQYVQHEIGKDRLKSDDFKIKCSPKYISSQIINNLVQQDMKITQTINKNLQQKQLQAKKRNTNSSLCCFTFEQLWNILQQQYSKSLYLEQYEQSTKQRIKILIQKNINILYQIFFYYFIIEYQQKDKKQDLSITYQHVFHFLRDYSILTQMKDLLNFIQFYNSDYKFNRIQDTLDIQKYGIKFPHFIQIMLKAIQFLQTSTLIMKGQTFDSAVTKVIQKIVQTQKRQQIFTDYRRNLRQNAKLISFVRNYSQNLKKVFIYYARTSFQNSASQFCLKIQQVKKIVSTTAITQKNTDFIVEECFNQLGIQQDGLFFYQFLQIIYWFALATVNNEGKQIQAQNQDEQFEALIQKLKFITQKISSNIN